MKTEVIISEGKTKIVLTPENDFENDVLVKLEYSCKGYVIATDIKNVFKNSNLRENEYRIEMELTEKK